MRCRKYLSGIHVRAQPRLLKEFARAADTERGGPIRSSEEVAVASARVGRAALSLGFDIGVFVLGLVVAVPSLVAYFVLNDGRLTALDLVWIALVVIMSRFPLMLTHKSGDIELGFETCILVFLVLTRAPLEAFSIWAIATTLAVATQRKSDTSRCRTRSASARMKAAAVSPVPRPTTMPD